MIRYIPDFILEQHAARELKGSFTGFALLIDIADFTPISTEFQKHGKQGAEELSAFELKWNPRKKSSAPLTFVRNYPGVSVELINRENYLPWLLSKPEQERSSEM